MHECAPLAFSHTYSALVHLCIGMLFICLLYCYVCTYVRVIAFYSRFQDGYFKTGDIAERRGESIVLIDRYVSIPATHTGDC